jgi:hypothetical protein
VYLALANLHHVTHHPFELLIAQGCQLFFFD